jgi:hypothetical protein
MRVAESLGSRVVERVQQAIEAEGMLKAIAADQSALLPKSLLHP